MRKSGSVREPRRRLGCELVAVAGTLPPDLELACPWGAGGPPLGTCPGGEVKAGVAAAAANAELCTSSLAVVGRAVSLSQRQHLGRDVVLLCRGSMLR